MIKALQIFCLTLSALSFIAFLAGEKDNKPAYLCAAVVFVALAMVGEVVL